MPNPNGNRFVYVDLSTYDTAASCRLYADVFGWQIYDMGQGAASGEGPTDMTQVSYHLAMMGDQTVAGIYDMPPFFKKNQHAPILDVLHCG